MDKKKLLKMLGAGLAIIFAAYSLWPIITNQEDQGQSSLSQEYHPGDGKRSLNTDASESSDSSNRLGTKSHKGASQKEGKSINGSDGDSDSDANDNHLVYITGAVERPGLYAMHKEVSVNDAIKAAGGLLAYADTAGIDMAGLVDAGSHIHIPFNYKGNPEALLRKAGININTASEKELDSLPGVGPATAKRIIEYRQEKGQFASIEDIKKVKGIGDGTFKKFKDKITV